MFEQQLDMQEYRSGHNEAVLKTVRPKATGVRIPQPAPKTPTFQLVFFYFLYQICVRSQWVGEQKQLIIIFAKPKPPKATSRQSRVLRRR